MCRRLDFRAWRQCASAPSSLARAQAPQPIASKLSSPNTGEIPAISGDGTRLIRLPVLCDSAQCRGGIFAPTSRYRSPLG